jgi:hypothetical protein
MDKKDYDLVVIGGGPAGIIGASTAAGFGKSVALVSIIVRSLSSEFLISTRAFLWAKCGRSPGFTYRTPTVKAGNPSTRVYDIRFLTRGA